jgi:hypothetical protein
MSETARRHLSAGQDRPRRRTTTTANPYRMAAVQGRVVEVRPDEGCRYMDPISFKHTGAPFPPAAVQIACAS